MIKRSYALIFGCLILNATWSQAKDFTSYYRQVNQAEELFVNNKTKESIDLYTLVFKEFDQPFVKDCYIASQISYYAGDTQAFLNFLDIGFKNGMPISAIDYAPILKNLQANKPLYQKIVTEFRNDYKGVKTDRRDIDTMLAMSYVCDSLKFAFAKDKDENTARKFLASDETFRQFVYRKYIRKGIFPLEKITGIKTDTTFSSFDERNNKPDIYPKFTPGDTFTTNTGVKIKFGEPEKDDYNLSNTLAFNIFIHSTCVMQEYGKDLWQCVLNGYMHPKDYGMLEEMSIAWNRQSSFSKFSHMCDYEKKDAYYNILNNDPSKPIKTFVTDEKLLAEVEKNRKDHLMQKYAIDVEKRKLEKEKGFRFFFGFMHMR